MITIYKKNNSDKILIIQYYTDGDCIVQKSGREDGKLVERRSTCVAKNVGRSNETTPEQQAVKEMLARIESKCKTDYFKTREEALGSNVLLPMLADTYAPKMLGKVNILQPKLDGQRCLVHVKNGNVELTSRKNRPIATAPYINERFKTFPDGVYDGEIYTHGYSFQTVMRLLKKYRPGLSESLDIHIYDIVDKKLNYNDRHALISKIISEQDVQGIKVIENTLFESFEQLEEFHNNAVADDYEGVMIRVDSCMYKTNGRSKHLLKYKDCEDVKLICKDIVPFEKDPTQGKAVFEFNNELTTAAFKMPVSERQLVLTNKDEYIGQEMEIRYFGLTDEGQLRHARCLGFTDMD